MSQAARRTAGGFRKATKHNTFGREPAFGAANVEREARTIRESGLSDHGLGRRFIFSSNIAAMHFSLSDERFLKESTCQNRSTSVELA
jgi:hypothetical protein